MSAMPPPLKDSLDLEELSKSLKKKRCVLMLGPRIATVAEGGQEVPIMEGLALEFARQLDEMAAKDASFAKMFTYEKKSERNLPYVSHLYLRGQMYLRGQKIDNADVRKKAQQYILEKSGPETYIPPIYEELAKLPVRVFVNTTPDDFMLRALKKANKTPLDPVNYNFEVTSGSERNELQTSVDYTKVKVSTPLVFNLFGNIRDANSMVITEPDQVKFVHSVLSTNSRIPEGLLALLPPDNTYLFFGFNLDNWQFRLMLSALGLGEKAHTLSPQSDNYTVTEVTKAYLRHEFNFHFVDKHMAEFAREISSLVSGDGTENVFISYAEGQEDQEAVQKILGTFNLFGKKMNIWHRGLVAPGDDVEKKVAEELGKATIVVPLLTSDYLINKQINDVEIPLMQTLLDKGQAEIAPILLKYCSWKLVDFFAHSTFTRLPNNSADPVFGGNKEDEACVHIGYEFQKRFL